MLVLAMVLLVLVLLELELTAAHLVELVELVAVNSEEWEEVPANSEEWETVPEVSVVNSAAAWADSAECQVWVAWAACPVDETCHGRDAQ